MFYLSPEELQWREEWIDGALKSTESAVCGLLQSIKKHNKPNGTPRFGLTTAEDDIQVIKSVLKLFNVGLSVARDTDASPTYLVMGLQWDEITTLFPEELADMRHTARSVENTETKFPTPTSLDDQLRACFILVKQTLTEHLRNIEKQHLNLKPGGANVGR